MRGRPAVVRPRRFRRGYGEPVTRLCARPDCSEPATATLTFGYRERTAWLDDLAGEPLPSSWDLCTRHADRLSVPLGWARDDRRAAHPLRPPRSLAS